VSDFGDPDFGAGERVIVTVRTPQDPDYPAHALPGDRGTVISVAPRMRNRPVLVRIDRTGRDATVFESRLAPETDTP
jgi:hypothetical protein